MNIGVKENTVQLLFIGSIIILVGIISFFKWPDGVTGATTQVPSCVEAKDGAIVTTNIKLCTGTYDLPSGLWISADGITVDCNEAVIAGSGFGNGITIKANGITLKDCIVKNYKYGILDDGIDNKIVNVDFKDNEFYMLDK